MAKKTNDINKNLVDTLKEENVTKKKASTKKKTTKTQKVDENAINVKFKKMSPDAILPTYAHDGDEGLDMYCTEVEYVPEKDLYILHTGIACETDKNIAGRLHVRSSNCNTELYLTNHVGIVDSEIYRGEIQFRWKNRDSLIMIANVATNRVFISLPWYKRIFSGVKMWDKIYNDTLEELIRLAPHSCPYLPGDKIGQIVFEEFKKVNVIEVDELSETVRGEGGFGSSGR